MASSPTSAKAGWQSIWLGPWGVLLAALAVSIIGMLAGKAGSEAVQALSAIAGLIAAGSAVAWRLQYSSFEFESRIESAAIVFLAGLLAELDLHTVPKAWDSAPMFLRVLAAVGVAGALILLLPTLGRKIAISLLILFHFGGIFTTVTAVEPNGQPAPWLSLQAWTRIYRPYLGFMYLNNAYHFYSPEPGPPTLLWIRMEYADETFRWVKIPVRKESPVPLHYQRMLALTESTNMVNPNPMSDADFALKLHNRKVHGNIRDIRLHPSMPPTMQYREPLPYSKKMLESYARFAGRNFKHLDDPSIPVTSVRIYKVVHSIILPGSMAAGYDPLHKTLYMPYYQGEYDPATGKLKDKDDPFLYWLLPIFSEEMMSPGDRKKPGTIINTLENHAGRQNPTSDQE